ncbi:nucleotidyltransferase family protein [Cellulophaga baltica]|uniref:nucleotidyltransferase family protein n=1 Tax=Cellulophaga baltica TaxID=76594 RepID=UPI002494AB78|nr:nucleotidyltransferase family protein [Cellulophaga baltica]
MNKILINENNTILEALNKLNSIKDVSRLILFVQDDNKKIIGTLTDGDIRRSLTQKKNIQEKISSVCNRNFTSIQKGYSFINLKEYRNRDLKIIPVLDEEQKFVEILDIDKIKAVLPLECMIMAGGRGKRLSPLTDNVPKPMLLLGGIPIIEHNINRLISYGIKKIYISVKYLGEQIEDYFGDGSSKGISIQYVWEEQPLGTAGALSLVDKFKSKHVLLMNSDLFTNVDFEDLYLTLIESDAEMAVASTEYKVDIPYAVFETKGNYVKNFKEKPSYIYQSNAGIYILKTEVIKEIPKNSYFDITDLMEKIVNENRKLIYNPILGYWIDIGKPVDYKYAKNFIKHLEL